MTIRLHVERLVLEGLAVAGADRARLERAVVAELTRLLEGGDSADRATSALGSGGAIAARRGRDVQMQPGGTMAVLGEEVARAVYGALVPAAGAMWSAVSPWPVFPGQMSWSRSDERPAPGAARTAAHPSGRNVKQESRP